MNLKRALPVCLSVAVVASCSDMGEVSAPPRPQFNFTSSVPVTLKLQLPGGSTNVCAALGGAGTIRLQLFNTTTKAFATFYNPNNSTGNSSRIVNCANAQTTYNVLPGDYDANFTIQTANDFGQLPRRWMQALGTVSSATSVVSDLVNGQPLRGGFYVDGESIGGVTVQLLHPGYGQISTNATSTATDWSDAITGQSRVYLRPGDSYQLALCGGLGVTPVGDGGNGVFVFDANTEVSCRFTKSVATQYTHDHTALVASMGPGDFGFMEPVDPAVWGANGFGVQYPVDANGPVHLPAQASHMFQGGLLVATTSGVVLSATNVGGYLFDCVGECRDFDADAKVHKTDDTPHGRTITWTYSDAGSATPVGLHVTQTSFDGKAPNDYVLVKYTFHNKGKNDLTFFAGGFYDWDVEELGTAPAERGGTALGGRLMYNVGNAGTHVGTMMISDYAAAGALHFATQPGVRVTIADQIAAMNGSNRAETTARADARYIQSMGPISIKKGHKAEVWVAIVAGRNQAEITANALAAEADATSRN